MKKALVFSPYLDTFGGGERYFLQVVEFLGCKGFHVDIAWHDELIKEKSKQRFGISLDKVKISPEAYELFLHKNLLKKFLFTRRYDLVFFVSDGSIPFLFGKKNYLHFQVPFKSPSKKLFTKLKLQSITKVICNSFFTKNIIDREFKVNSLVLFPPLAEGFKASVKKNIILSVGRFDNLLHSKKQDVMISIFKKMIDEKKLLNWQLVLAGSCLKGKEEFLKYIKQISVGYPIKIKDNIDFKTLIKLNAESKIYWHVTGFGEDLDKYPERAEHFGLSVVEAMSSEALVIVFNAGGLPEIVTSGKDGFLFKKLDQLENITLKYAKDEKERVKLAKNAQNKSRQFKKAVFFKKLDEIIFG
jgi:glycosyltransferase involved in cell wall biosynthesis